MALKFNRRLRAKAVVDMAPMIDIVFQLIIFFMVATTFKTTTGMELRLPQATQVTTISTTPLQITIVNEQKIKVGTQTATIESLDAILRSTTYAESTDRKTILLSADENTNYKLLIQVMDIVKLAGFDALDLALEKKSTK